MKGTRAASFDDISKQIRLRAIVSRRKIHFARTNVMFMLSQFLFEDKIELNDSTTR